MSILILGGGSVGGKLALDLEEPFTLIEADPSRVWELKDLLKDKEVPNAVVHGDGNSIEVIEKVGGKEFDVAVVLMNRDLENLEAVSILRGLGIPRIIARVNAPHNMYKFIGLGAEVFQHPIGYEEGLIKTMLFPDSKHAIQIFVKEDSPAVGCSIRDLGLPEGCVIGSILREDSLVPPTLNTHIRSGDLIAIDMVGKKARKVWRIFSKTGKIESSGHILYPLVKDRDLMAVKEVELLAKRLGSEINFISIDGKEELITSARGFMSKRIPCSTMSMDSAFHDLLDDPGKGSLKVAGLGKRGRALQNLMFLHMDEGSPHLDFFVVPGPKPTMLYFPFISSDLDRIILGAPMPVLVSRSSKKYRSILLYLHPNCNQEISIAIQICRSLGSRLTALYKPRNNRRALYLKRFAQVYDVEVDVKKIVGDPTVELIKEVKGDEHDLVILKKNLKEIHTSQMRRLVHLWTGSVLIVP
ncbi:MAG: NAD-binding protein [Candidatus Thermoplasmatota archaeon]|nr:NAD-binding protein [Candidatus Thermoplasmatota archaeon]